MLVALVIVAIAASMFLYFADALRLTKVARQETTASNYAKNYLASLQSYWQDPENYVYGLAYAESLAATVPEGFTLYVKVEDEKGRALLDYPDSGASPGKVESRLRYISLKLIDGKGKELSMTSRMAYPPPRP